MNEAVHVREAREDDVPAIIALERSSPEAPHWTTEQYREMLRAGDGPQQRRRLIVAVVGEVVEGYVAASMLLEEAELESIVVAEHTRRSGVGRMLLQAVLEWAGESGAREMRLEVRASNVRARGLYEAMGFRQTGSRRGYYSHPAEDAVLMGCSFEEPKCQSRPL